MTQYPPPYGEPGEGQPYGGQQYGYGTAPQQDRGTNGLAVAALVLSFFIGLLGVILGVVARSRIARSGQGGRSLATAAIVVGALNMVLGACTALAALGGGG